MGTTPGYENRNSSIPDSTNHRPPTKTKSGKIYGIQTAVVTAEEHEDSSRPEINADELGSVRVRFPWDQRQDQNDKTPTSDWIRVSQYWAGAGYGAVYTPRVGHEVLVAFLDGNPKKPVIVGRVYNSKNRPPIDPSGEDRTKSTIRSDTSVDKDPSNDEDAHERGFNEIQFEDRDKKEQIYIHAQRDLNEVVLADHSTSVGGDQSNTVGHNQTNEVMNERFHTVHAVEWVHVIGDRVTNYDANETKTVGVDQLNIIVANQTTTVGGWQQNTIEGTQTTNVGWSQINTCNFLQKNTVDGHREHTVTSYEEETIGAFHTRTVGGFEKIDVTGARTVNVGGLQTFNTGGFLSNSPTVTFNTKPFTVNNDTTLFNDKTSFDVHAGSASLHMSAGCIVLDNGAGATVSLVGSMVMINAPCCVVTTAGANIQTSSGGVTLATAGGPMFLISGGAMNATAPQIKLNG